MSCWRSTGEQAGASEPCRRGAGRWCEQSFRAGTVGELLHARPSTLSLLSTRSSRGSTCGRAPLGDAHQEAARPRPVAPAVPDYPPRPARSFIISASVLRPCGASTPSRPCATDAASRQSEVGLGPRAAEPATRRDNSAHPRQRLAPLFQGPYRARFASHARMNPPRRSTARCSGVQAAAGRECGGARLRTSSPPRRAPSGGRHGCTRLRPCVAPGGAGAERRAGARRGRWAWDQSRRARERGGRARPAPARLALSSSLLTRPSPPRVSLSEHACQLPA